MISVDRLFKVFLCLAIATTIFNVVVKYKDSPQFMDGRSSQLYYSDNLNFKLNGDVFFIEDYHTVNYRMFFNKKSHSSRVISGEEKGVYFSYFADFYTNNLVQFTEFTLPNGTVGDKKVIEVEAHALRRLNNELLQIIHWNKKVLCYTKLLEGGIKCIIRRK